MSDPTPPGRTPDDQAPEETPEEQDAVRPDGADPARATGLTGTDEPDLPRVDSLRGADASVESTNVAALQQGATPEQATEGRAELRRQVDDGEPVQVAQRRGMFGARDGADTSGYGGLRTEVLLPGAAERPYGGYYDEVVDLLATATGGSLLERVVVDRGELTLAVARDDLREVMQALRDEPGLRFEMCMSVSGVHWPQETGRELHVCYELLSITHGGRRVRVEVTAPDADPHVPSVVGIYPSVDWHERETWDMFGVVFDDRPDLTRILMPDDWPGHPQRKDYPLGGIPVEYKGGTVPPPDERRTYS